LRAVLREDHGMDDVLREVDCEPADGNQDDPEDRIDRSDVLTPRPRLDRVPQHEIRRIEEEEDEEEHELVRAPDPPVSPPVTRPDRACDEHEHTEDHALMDRNVALEVCARLALPEMDERLPCAPPEPCIRGQRDRNVEVEDLLVEAVGVERRPEKDQ